jgi:hypothetical protein
MKRWMIGHGDRAIRKTILHMHALVIGPEGVGHPDVRVAALEAVRGSVKNLNEIDFVLDWVKKHIEFRGENAETLQSPVVTLQLGAGDCDDHSILIAALLRSLGYNVQFKTVAAQRADPTQFSHVYVIVQDKRTGQWKGLDSTVPDSFAGWEPRVIYREQTYRLGDDTSTQDLTPTGQLVYDIANPLVQAAASRIQYGNNPPMLLAPSGLSSVSPIIWLLLIGGAMIFISQGRGRR